MRLRPLTEAECYARCYGERAVDSVHVLRPGADRAVVTTAPEGTGAADQPQEREAA
ncbi:MAG TPA: hypothetical protein VG265_10675 [Gaiellaceae bacterium]|nr:hypothetical protein [Gaiellaceae bacterium]